MAAICFFIIVIIILFSDFLQLPYPEPFCWKLASMLPLLFFPYSHAVTFESLEDWICQALLCPWRCEGSCWHKPPTGDTSWAQASTPFFPENLLDLPTPCLLIAISCSFPHISLLLGSGRGEEKWTAIGAGRKQKESRSWSQEIWVLDLAFTMPLCFKMDMCAERDFHPVSKFLLALTFFDALQCSEHAAVFDRQHRKA